MGLLTVSGSPHVQSKETTKSIMWNVVIALLPALLVGIYYFGFRVLSLTLVSIAACLLFEWLIQKFLLKGKETISDGSAVITGILLAFNLPSDVPSYIVVIGAFVAIAIGKMTFGGLGKNPFNPALVGRVFLFLSFPTEVAKSEWPKPQPLFDSKVVDALSGPTPLAEIGAKSSQNLDALQLFLGSTGGSFGEVAAIAILLGGIYLLIRRVITWHIPVTFIASAGLFAGILWLCGVTVNPVYHLLAGGLMLGAVFMATDMVTSPVTKKGQLIFGVGCGLLTILFRCFGPMPEGVSFAILIMNALTPLINKMCKPKRFGY
ncbi:MAG: RnfABCDGE type electron transport complex subunit D [Bacteroidales bacterium]|nr:RnfABCDGE type electron transport complex subunit D [Bacteroidales bacterium]